MVTGAVEGVVAVIGHLPVRAGTREAGPPQVPAMNDARNVRRLPRTSYATIRRKGTGIDHERESSIPPIRRFSVIMCR
jgi:hypothetical protein